MIKDIFSNFLLFVVSTLVLIGLFFSGIITINTYLGKQEAVVINQPVLKYSSSLTKNGRQIHIITIINPKTKKPINLTVFKQYIQGELFSKQMYCGSLGILYSKD